MGNEVTIFGADYDGAISSGYNGWACHDCDNWNKESDIDCRYCEPNRRIYE